MKWRGDWKYIAAPQPELYYTVDGQATFTVGRRVAGCLSTTTRQPMLSLSPWATMVPTITGPLMNWKSATYAAISATRHVPTDGVLTAEVTHWRGGGALVAATRTSVPAARRWTAS